MPRPLSSEQQPISHSDSRDPAQGASILTQQPRTGALNAEWYPKYDNLENEEFINSTEQVQKASDSDGDSKPKCDIEKVTSAKLPTGFRLTKNVIEKKKGKKWIAVFSKLIIEADTRDVRGHSWGRVLIVTDRDGNEHQWSMPMFHLAGEGLDYRRILLAMGLEIAPGKFARDAIHEYISNAEPSGKVRCVDKIGWHDRNFILPDAAFGKSSGERIMLQTESPLEHAFNSAGTLEGWRKHVARKCAGNSRLILALSTAAAGPLLAMLGAESGGVHIVGFSSSGKTTCLNVGGSFWGGGGKNGQYIQQWRTTDNALEAIAMAHNDTLLCLDELSQIDPKAAAAIAYMLANGVGKRRATQTGGAQPTAQWRLLYLSCGEITLGDKIAEDGRNRKVAAGQQVRMIDVPADAGAGLGIFETLHGYESRCGVGRSFKICVQRALWRRCARVSR